MTARAKWCRAQTSNRSPSRARPYATLVEVGDGDYFRIWWVSKAALRWSEELFEILALAAYLAAFLTILAGRKPKPRLTLRAVFR